MSYNYLLFRVYRFYRDNRKEDKGMALFYTTVISSLFIILNFLTFYFFLESFLDLKLTVYKNITILLISLLFCILNYIFFVRNEYFLEKGFSKNSRGSYSVLFYIFLSIVLFVVVANVNRAKIFGRTSESLMKNTKKIK